jgi:iron complex outermembrane receptor protein
VHSRILLLATVSAVAAVVPAAHAAHAAQLEEVIVTARKREESILRVPVVETAIPQAAIEKYQIHDLYTLAAHVPGIVMGTQLGAVSTGVSLRGVGTTAVNPTIDQAVSLNIDGLQLSQSVAYSAGIFDLGQVEVLKGPQALFYGKNSPGGVISLRTADPTGAPEVILRAGYEAEAQEKVTEVIVSGPLTDALKARLAAHYSDNNGYFRNRDTAPVGYGVVTPSTKRFSTDKNWVLRGTLLFEPNSTYKARLKVNYTYDFRDNGGGDPQLKSCPYGKTSFTGLPIFDPNEDCTLNRDVYLAYMDPKYWPGIRNGGVPFIKTEQEFGTLEQNLRHGALTFTSVTGVYNLKLGASNNASATSGLVTLAGDVDFYIRQFTQEFRLTSDFTDQPVNFMVGGFYQNARQTYHAGLRGNTGIPKIPLPVFVQNVINAVDISSISAFGQATWNITDKIELAGGARWTHEHREHTQFNIGTPGVPLGPTPLLDPKIRSSNISPEATLSYRPNADLTLFASYKQGFKSGSFNTVSYIGPNDVASFGDEKVVGGEAGVKARLMDRTLQVNAAIYDYKYTGLQVGTNGITPQGVIVLRTLNAAAAKVRGVDFDITYAPPQAEGLVLRAAVNYNHARFTNFPNAPCGNGQLIAEGCNQLFNPTTGRYSAQDLSGHPLPRAPDWILNGGFDYNRPVGADMTLSIGGNVTYTDDFFQALLTDPNFIQKAYAKVGASVALKGRDDAWEVALIGNNLTDKITAGYCYNGSRQGATIFGGVVSGTNARGPGGGDYPGCIAERGREVWLRVTVRPLLLSGGR